VLVGRRIWTHAGTRRGLQWQTRRSRPRWVRRHLALLKQPYSVRCCAVAIDMALSHLVDKKCMAEAFARCAFGHECGDGCSTRRASPVGRPMRRAVTSRSMSRERHRLVHYPQHQQLTSASESVAVAPCKRYDGTSCSTPREEKRVGQQPTHCARYYRCRGLGLPATTLTQPLET
jgi:hypothetical protein